MRRFKSKRGFTLVELLVSSFVLFLLSGLLFQFMFLFHNLRKADEVKLELMNSGKTVMEQMLWGIRRPGIPNRYGLWEAESFAVGNGGASIQFTGSDGLVRTVQTANGNKDIQYNDANGAVLLFDGSPGPENDDYQVNMTFNQILPSVVQVNLVLSKRIIGRWHHASVSTEVALRN